MDINMAKEVAALRRMTVNDLRARYADVCGEATRVRNKDWLIKRIAWRLQANAEGDLSERARRRAAELANDAELRRTPPKSPPPPSDVPKRATVAQFASAENRLPPPGSVITRDYKGQTLQVKVLPGGFEFEGEVCENRFATILERRHAEMRSLEREAGSLNQPIRDAEGTRAESGATISESQPSRRTGQHRRSREEMWDLAHDLADILEQMTPTMRKVCEILMHDSKTTAARELGMSRGALYETIDRIRVRFEKAGLRDYLK